MQTPSFLSDFLNRLGAGEGLWVMAMTALATLFALLASHHLSGTEFVSAFTAWVTFVFGSAAVAGFRDWRKPPKGGPTDGGTP